MKTDGSLDRVLEGGFGHLGEPCPVNAHCQRRLGREFFADFQRPGKNQGINMSNRQWVEKLATYVHTRRRNSIGTCSKMHVHCGVVVAR